MDVEQFTTGILEIMSCSYVEQKRKLLAEAYAKVLVTKIIAVGPCCWGIGATIPEAVAGCRAN